MANAKVTGLTESTAPALTDLIYGVVDPSGTPASRKMTLQTIANLLAAFPHLVASKKYHLVGTVLRFNDSAGAFRSIGGDSHVDIGLTSVSSDTSAITITHDTSDFGANPKIITSQVVPDETYSQLGINIGASVTTSATTLTMTTRGVSDRMQYNGSSWTSTRGYLSAAWDGANDRVTFTGDGTPGTITGSLVGPSGIYTHNTPPQVTGYDTHLICAEEGSGTNAGKPFVRVAFYEPTTGAKLTAESTDMKCSVWLPFAYHIMDPSQFTEDNSNIWYMALIQSDR